MNGATLWLAATSAFAMAASYAYQLLASATLSPSEFAWLNHWLFWVGFGSAFGVLVQFTTSLASFQISRALTRKAAFGFALMLTLLVASPWRSSGLTIGIASVLAYFLVGYLFGEHQRRANLVALGWMNLATSSTRMLVKFAPAGSTWFMLAVPAGSVLAMAAGVLSPVREELQAAEPAKEDVERVTAPRMQSLVSGLLLTLTGLLFPFLDFELVYLTCSKDASSAFAGAHLMAKVPYFGGLVLLQVLYPLQLRANAKRTATGEASGSSSVLPWLPAAVALAIAVGSTVWSSLGPAIYSRLAHRPLFADPSAVQLATTNFAFLFFLQAKLQELAAKRTLGPSAKGLLVMLVGLVLVVAMAFLRPSSGGSTLGEIAQATNGLLGRLSMAYAAGCLVLVYFERRLRTNQG